MRVLIFSLLTLMRRVSRRADTGRSGHRSVQDNGPPCAEGAVAGAEGSLVRHGIARRFEGQYS